MKEHRYDEFSISMSWRSSSRGSYPRTETPGFHLRMGWANEGEAEWIFDGLITLGALENIYATLYRELDLPAQQERTITQMRTRYEQDRKERLARLKEQRIRIEAQIKAMESEEIA